MMALRPIPGFFYLFLCHFIFMVAVIQGRVYLDAAMTPQTDDLVPITHPPASQSSGSLNFDPLGSGAAVRSRNQSTPSSKPMSVPSSRSSVLSAKCNDGFGSYAEYSGTNPVGCEICGNEGCNSMEEYCRAVYRNGKTDSQCQNMSPDPTLAVETFASNGNFHATATPTWSATEPDGTRDPSRNDAGISPPSASSSAVESGVSSSIKPCNNGFGSYTSANGTNPIGCEVCGNGGCNSMQQYCESVARSGKLDPLCNNNAGTRPSANVLTHGSDSPYNQSYTPRFPADATTGTYGRSSLPSLPSGTSFQNSSLVLQPAGNSASPDAMQTPRNSMVQGTGAASSDVQECLPASDPSADRLLPLGNLRPRQPIRKLPSRLIQNNVGLAATINFSSPCGKNSSRGESRPGSDGGESGSLRQHLVGNESSHGLLGNLSNSLLRFPSPPQGVANLNAAGGCGDGQNGLLKPFNRNGLPSGCSGTTTQPPGQFVVYKIETVWDDGLGSADSMMTAAPSSFVEPCSVCYLMKNNKTGRIPDMAKMFKQEAQKNTATSTLLVTKKRPAEGSDTDAVNVNFAAGGQRERNRVGAFEVSALPANIVPAGTAAQKTPAPAEEGSHVDAVPEYREPVVNPTPPPSPGGTNPDYGSSSQGDQPFGQEPSGGNQPSGVDQPSGGNQPSGGDEPSGVDQPSGGNQPSGGDQPSGGNQPTNGGPSGTESNQSHGEGSSGEHEGGDQFRGQYFNQPSTHDQVADHGNAGHEVVQPAEDGTAEPQQSKPHPSEGNRMPSDQFRGQYFNQPSTQDHVNDHGNAEQGAVQSAEDGTAELQQQSKPQSGPQPEQHSTSNEQFSGQYFNPPVNDENTHEGSGNLLSSDTPAEQRPDQGTGSHPETGNSAQQHNEPGPFSGQFFHPPGSSDETSNAGSPAQIPHQAPAAGQLASNGGDVGQKNPSDGVSLSDGYTGGLPGSPRPQSSNAGANFVDHFFGKSPGLPVDGRPSQELSDQGSTQDLDIPGATLHGDVPSVSTNVQGTPVKLSPQEVVIGSQTFQRGDGPSSAVVNGQTFRWNADRFFAPSKSIPFPSPKDQGSNLIAGGVTFDVLPSGIGVDGTTIQKPQSSLSSFVAHGGRFLLNPSQLISPEQNIPLPAATGPKPFIYKGQSLSADGKYLYAGSTSIALSSGGVVSYDGEQLTIKPTEVVGPHTTIPLSASPTFSTTTYGSITISVAPSEVAVGDVRVQNLRPGMTPFTTIINGQSVKIGPGGVQIGSATITLPTTEPSHQVTTVGDLTISLASTEAVIDGQTFKVPPGSQPTTTDIDGYALVIGPSGVHVEGTTIALTSWTAQLTASAISIGSTDVVIGGSTYAIGSGAPQQTLTLGSNTITLGTQGVVLPPKTLPNGAVIPATTLKPEQTSTHTDSSFATITTQAGGPEAGPGISAPGSQATGVSDSNSGSRCGFIASSLTWSALHVGLLVFVIMML